MKVKKHKELGEYSNKAEHLITKKIPAVTIVAAWIKAETGVGPSMASGNQACKPSWADLPNAPSNKKKQITFNKLNSTPKKKKLELDKYGIILNKVKKFNDPISLKIKTIPVKIKKSPIRLTSMAFKADFNAGRRVFQKLINKYEHKPTPSQPKNKTIKLSEVTRINIKKTNKHKYEINLGKLGSEYM